MPLTMGPASPGASFVPKLKTLSTHAADLNAATKRLAKTVIDIELGLKKLNLGVSSWVPVSSKEDEADESLGYAKVKGKWGLVIREFEIDGGGDVIGHNDFSFAEATRDARVRAIAFLPALLDKLSEDAAAVTAKLTKNIEAAETLAKLINAGDSVVSLHGEIGGSK